MSFPNLSDKHTHEAMFSPQDFMAYLKEIGEYPDFTPPRGVIFCYQRSLLEYVINNHKNTPVKGFHSQMFLLEETDNQVAIVGKFGIGAPVVVTLLEELIAFGVKKFISVGTAGTLQKNIKLGSFMVCDRAIRDEGCSHHYLPPSKYSHASPEMTDKLCAELDKIGQTYTVGTTWTIDTPYRETVAEVKHYQAEGVATVEMEAAALFAVAEYRQVELGSIFTISDSLAELEWRPKFHAKITKEGLEIIYQAAVNVLFNHN